MAEQILPIIYVVFCYFFLRHEVCLKNASLKVQYIQKNKNMNYLPSKLSKLRKHYNYSQSYLAEVLKVDVITYMGYENGREMINYNQCKKLSSLYHISVYDMFLNSDEVELYDVYKANTDEINIEYFIPKKNIFQLLLELPYFKQIAGIFLLCIFVLFIVIGQAKPDPYTITTSDVDKLSSSQTSVVYIDELGAVKGSGDNSNGQLSNLPSSKAIKVQEGFDFTVVLYNDGTMSAIGLNQSDLKNIEKWINIQDVAAGDNHVVAIDNKGKIYCTGDNSLGQCDVQDFDKVSKVFAAPNATIAIGVDGTVYYTGKFVGTSAIRKLNNIIALDSNEKNLIFVKDDGTCHYVASYDKKVYSEVYKWKDVIDVTCGDDFFAALIKDGTVKIAIENYEVKEEVESWTNIIAISSGDDYIVGYDGKEIFGAGSNKYNQYISNNEVAKPSLPQVKNLKIDYDSNYIYVTFDEVKNCDSYKVSLDAGTNIVYKAKANEVVKFDTSTLIDGYFYEVSVIALGNDKYKDSTVSSEGFIYTKVIEDTSNDEKITIKSNLNGLSKKDIVNYLNEIGVNNFQIIDDEDTICQSSNEEMIKIEGIKPGSTYARSILDKIEVKCTFCKLENKEI